MYAHNYRLSSLKWIADSGEHTGGTQKYPREEKVEDLMKLTF